MSKITYHGHSCFSIEENGKTVLIDPFFTGNPSAGKIPEKIKPEIILVTHGHGDHLGDAVEISRKTSSPILAVFELANYCSSKGANALPAHMGGKIKFEWGWVKLVPAHHSSSTNEGLYAGNPVGFVIKLYNTVYYHAGDTALFGDMALIGKPEQIDVAMIPIGGHFTMDIEDAVEAVKLLKPKAVIPMHYNTFDLIKADADEFKNRIIKEAECKCILLEPKNQYELQ